MARLLWNPCPPRPDAVDVGRRQSAGRFPGMLLPTLLCEQMPPLNPLPVLTLTRCGESLRVPHSRTDPESRKARPHNLFVSGTVNRRRVGVHRGIHVVGLPASAKHPPGPLLWLVEVVSSGPYGHRSPRRPPGSLPGSRPDWRPPGSRARPAPGGRHGATASCRTARARHTLRRPPDVMQGHPFHAASGRWSEPALRCRGSSTLPGYFRSVVDDPPKRFARQP